MTEHSASVIDQLQARIEELEAQLADCQSQIDRLTAREARFRAIAEHANDIICTINHTGQLTYVSPNVEEALSYTPAEMEGHDFHYLLHPDDLDHCVQSVQHVLETGQPYTGLEYRTLHKQGHYRTGLTSL